MGDGRHINAWEDSWLEGIRLSSVFTYRFIRDYDFFPNTTARGMVERFGGVWPMDWIAQQSNLATIQLPMVVDSRPDMVVWRRRDNTMCLFTVRDAVKALLGDRPGIQWTKMVWFKGNIPKHSFCLWLACQRRLPTQDRMLLWKEDPPDMRCSLCDSCVDSHDHLFFGCPFSCIVWQGVKKEIRLVQFPDDWSAIMVRLDMQGGFPRRLLHRLSLAATVYYIWQERNRRLFTGNKRSPEKVLKEIIDVVLLRLAWRERIKYVNAYNAG